MIFESLTPDIRTTWGKQNLEAGEAMYPGNLVTLETDNTLDLAAAADKPDGFAFGDRRTYRPTTLQFSAGDEVTLLTGAGLAAASVDFFAAGSLPAVGNDLYSGAAGKIATSGSYKFGRVIDIVAQYNATGGVGTAENVAVFRFNFDSYS